MANSEFRIPNQARMTNDEAAAAGALRHSGFVIGSSFVIRVQPIGLRVQPVKVRPRELTVCPRSDIRRSSEVTHGMKARK